MNLTELLASLAIFLTASSAFTESLISVKQNIERSVKKSESASGVEKPSSEISIDNPLLNELPGFIFFSVMHPFDFYSFHPAFFVIH